MTAKKVKSAFVEKSNAANYKQRAKELLESMRNNLIMENWNAAVIDGVHAAISINDALTVAFSGRRSTADSHVDAAELLKQSLPSEMATEDKRLRRILYVKSHVEYGPSLVTRKNAEEVSRDVERFFAWAEHVYERIMR